MRNQVITETTAWLDDASASWNDDLAMGVEKSLMSLMEADIVADKVNEDKLAHDVEDLSAIFEQLEEGTVDFSLPCDDDDGVEDVHEDWIDELDRDAVNVEELSAAFEMLAQQTETSEASDASDAEMEDKSDSSDESDDVSEEDEDEEDAVRVVPTAPTWICGPPLDPRSVIRTPIFKDLDARIPSVEIPRMDLGFGNASAKPSTEAKAPLVVPSFQVRLSPKASADKKDGDAYVHDEATCWICKSDKSAFKKFALHRYLEKRRRRNWKRGPRYSGRSHVATNRVREGGRFVCTARWI